jgi:hypothetical protein
MPGRREYGEYMAGKTLKGSPDWQTVSVSLDELMPTKKEGQAAMTSWDTVAELSFRGQGTFYQGGKEVKFGEGSPGWNEPREFRNLRWEGGVENTAAEVRIGLAEGRPCLCERRRRLGSMETEGCGKRRPHGCGREVDRPIPRRRLDSGGGVSNRLHRDRAREDILGRRLLE